MAFFENKVSQTKKTDQNGSPNLEEQSYQDWIPWLGSPPMD